MTYILIKWVLLFCYKILFKEVRSLLTRERSMSFALVKCQHYRWQLKKKKNHHTNRSQFKSEEVQIPPEHQALPKPRNLCLKCFWFNYRILFNQTTVKNVPTKGLLVKRIHSKVTVSFIYSLAKRHPHKNCLDRKTVYLFFSCRGLKSSAMGIWWFTFHFPLQED